MDVKAAVSKIMNEDLELIDQVITELRAVRAGIASEMGIKADERAEKSLDQAEKDGKEHYNLLEISDEFFYRTAKGVVCLAKKVRSKSNTGRSAACELVWPLPEGPKTMRYPHFHQIIFPNPSEKELREMGFEDYLKLN